SFVKAETKASTCSDVVNTELVGFFFTEGYYNTRTKLESVCAVDVNTNEDAENAEVVADFCTKTPCAVNLCVVLEAELCCETFNCSHFEAGEDYYVAVNVESFVEGSSKTNVERESISKVELEAVAVVTNGSLVCVANC